MTKLSSTEEYTNSLNNARQALKKGDKKEARFWARLATKHNPSRVEPWLILAAVSTPKQSVVYFNKALKINPQSRRARKGMHWAGQRLGETEKPQTKKRSVKFTNISIRKKREKMGERGKKKKNKNKKTHLYHNIKWEIILFLAIVFVGISSLAWLGIPLFITKEVESYTFQRPEGALVKPSLPPTMTITPVDTPTPFHTATILPTMTRIFTSTPDKSYINYYAHSWDIPNIKIDDNNFWIEVDLSEQMLFAYSGSTLLQSFAVSTGTRAHPTVTGTYKIYAMYPYYSMRGPGYYLPDVPHSMFFYKGYSIHGTYWHNNFGIPMSHGCVNMETIAASWVYERTHIGTNVFVHY